MFHNNNILKILAFGFIALSAACFILLQQNKDLVQVSDIEPYLSEPAKDISLQVYRNQAQLDFWKKKLDEQPGSSIYRLKTALLMSERFKLNGQIEDIHYSDSLLHAALESRSIRKAPFYRALSANAITQHEFKRALQLAEQSLESALRPELSQLMRFDALLELGEKEKARKVLQEISDQTSFDVMIRKSKLQDQDGDLLAAIKTMEEAATWCKERNNKTLLVWTLSNLGDMYGHDGRIKSSYQAYKDVLQLDPSYKYALKGIAWIAFSKDKNTETARMITQHLLAHQQSPDLYLLMAEMNALEGDLDKSEEWEEKFIATVQQSTYGRMYDKYLAEFYLDQSGKGTESYPFIEKEIENRPAAATYALLARYQLKQGNAEKAVEILEEKVSGKTFEPDVLYHAGMIYQAAGQKDKAREYLKEAAEASFELGPLMSQKIKTSLKKINSTL